MPLLWLDLVEVELDNRKVDLEMEWEEIVKKDRRAVQEGKEGDK